MLPKQPAWTKVGGRCDWVERKLIKFYVVVIKPYKLVSRDKSNMDYR